MKKKIFFLGFLVGLFMCLMVLPASAVSLPSSSAGCDSCRETWEQIEEAHCDSACVCTFTECPACGQNTVLVYCSRIHNLDISTNYASGSGEGSLTKSCSVCKKSFTLSYTKHTCSNASREISATCISHGYKQYFCSGHESCLTNRGFGRSYNRWGYTAPLSKHNIIFLENVAASCQGDGYDLYGCENCPMTSRQNIVPGGSHDPSGDSVVVDATCTSVGSVTHTCKYCGVQYSETIPQLEHSYKFGFSVDDNGIISFYRYCSKCYDRSDLDREEVCSNHKPWIYSCDCGTGANASWNGAEWSRGGAGYDVYEDECDDCFVTIEFTIWNEHNYINVVRDGQIYAVCENCENETYVGVFDPDIDDGDPECDHDYVSVFYPQNCVDHGYFMFICSKCGDGYIDRYVDPLGHIPKGTTVEPTCTEEGYTEYICSRPGCGETWVDDRTPPLGHNYVNGFCTRCGKSDICVHTFLEHVVPPTCYDLGYTLYTCTQCGDSYMDNYVKRLEHKWKTMSKKSPTCDSYGYNELSCTLCGEAETERINPYGHKWVAKSTALREDNTADVTYRCSTCNALKIENLQSAAAQAQNWLVTSIRGVFGGVIDCYNILANGISIGGVTLGEVVTAGAIVVVLVGVLALCIKIAG